MSETLHIPMDVQNFEPRAYGQLGHEKADAYLGTWRAMTKPEQDLVRLEVMYNVDQSARVQGALAQHAMKIQADSTTAAAAFALAFLVLGMLVGWHWRSRAERPRVKAEPATVGA